LGAKYKESGGGASTGLANDFTGWLRGLLNTGTAQGGQQPAQPYDGRPRPNFGETYGFDGGSPRRDFGGFAQQPDGFDAPGSGLQNTAADSFNNANPTASTQGFSDVINNFLNGNFGSGVDTSGLKTPQTGFNFAPLQQSNVNFGNYNTNALKNFNAQNQIVNAPGSIVGDAGLQGSIGGLNKIGSYSPQQMLEFSKNFGAGAVNVPGAAGNVALDRPDLSQYTAELDRNKLFDSADLRARFGASGGASFGTPAAMAEGNFLAATNAKNATTLADIGRQQQMLGLQRDQLNTGNYNNWAGNVTQAGIAGLGNQTQMFGNMLGNQVNAYGKAGDLQLSALSDDAGNQLKADMANAVNNMTAQGLNLDAIAKATGLDLDTLNAIVNQNTANMGAFNTNQGLQANNQLGTNEINMNSLAKALGLDQDWAKFGVNTQGNMAQTIMQLLQNMSMPGIAPRQGYMKPSGFQNVVSGLQGIAGAVAPFNPFGGIGSFGGGSKSGGGGGLE
jgi:hypothetical protein